MLEGLQHRAASDGRAFWWRALADTVKTAPREHVAELRQDIRYALRAFRSQPVFTATVVAIIALGIGSNTAIFSLLRAGLYRSVPYPEPDRLVVVPTVLKGKEADRRWVSPYDFEFFRSRPLKAVSVLAGAAFPGTTIRMNNIPERHFAGQTAGPLFDELGAGARVGRLLTAADEQPGAAPVVLLDYEFWQSRFGGRSDVVGERVVVDGVDRQIIGVLDERFRFPLRAHIWIHLDTCSEECAVVERSRP